MTSSLPESSGPIRRHTPRSVSVLLVLLVVAVLGVELSTVVTARSVDASWHARLQLTEKLGQIQRDDEALTGSVRLAALSGDQAYVERYHATAQSLATVLAQAQDDVQDPQVTSAATRIGRANNALVALELESLRRGADGDRPGAWSVVTSSRYADLKQEYQSGVDEFAAALIALSDNHTRRARTLQQLSLVAGAVVLTLLGLVLWRFRRLLARTELARETFEERWLTEARADALTGLPNRRRFRDQMTAQLAGVESRGTALYFIDVDRFRQVNDSLGHSEGDRLLIDVARRLTRWASLHPTASVARLGGDEFAVLMPSIAADPLSRRAEEIADELVTVLGSHYESAGPIHTSVSVGLAVCAEPGADVTDLMRAADLALSVAKSQGGDCWRRYAEQMHTDLVARVELEGQLRDALAHDELVLHYQPIYDLSNGTVHGLEALIRWQHPQLGLLGPGHFIPIAEESDLINTVGRVVLEKACAQLSQWRRQRNSLAGVEIAVNVSAPQLRQPHFADEVGAILVLNDLEPSCLVLEITESTVMGDAEVVLQNLVALRALGIRIAIDDFGTGHSSLARLHDLPVDEVKVDRSFVVRASEDGDSVMLDMVVTLASRLSLDMVAEGVETHEQLTLLREIGARFAQGYLLGRPVPPEALLGVGPHPLLIVQAEQGS